MDRRLEQPRAQSHLFSLCRRFRNVITHHRTTCGRAIGDAARQEKSRCPLGKGAKALERNPHLHFELVTTLIGVNSITLYYKEMRGLSAEVFHVNADGKVVRAYAHYAQ